MSDLYQSYQHLVAKPNNNELILLSQHIITPENWLEFLKSLNVLASLPPCLRNLHHSYDSPEGFYQGK